MAQEESSVGLMIKNTGRFKHHLDIGMPLCLEKCVGILDVLPFVH